jgi:hypothetical protein
MSGGINSVSANQAAPGPAPPLAPLQHHYPHHTYGLFSPEVLNGQPIAPVQLQQQTNWPDAVPTLSALFSPSQAPAPTTLLGQFNFDLQPPSSIDGSDETSETFIAGGTPYLDSDYQAYLFNRLEATDAEFGKPDGKRSHVDTGIDADETAYARPAKVSKFDVDGVSDGGDVLSQLPYMDILSPSCNIDELGFSNFEG